MMKLSAYTRPSIFLIRYKGADCVGIIGEIPCQVILPFIIHCLHFSIYFLVYPGQCKTRDWS